MTTSLTQHARVRLAVDTPAPSPGRLAPVLLAGWWALLFLPGLSVGTLWRTEGLRARVADEMLARGDWLVPTLYGDPFLTKPPLHYAAICACSWPAGRVTEFSARLPSVLAGLTTALILTLTFGRLAGRRAGYLAGLLAPVSLLWLDKVPSAEIDALQVMWVTASLACLWRAVEPPVPGLSPGVLPRAIEGRPVGAKTPKGWRSIARGNTPGDNPRTGWYAAALLCVAAGVLTKWTAPAFFLCAAIPLLWRRGRLRDLIRPGHLIGVALALAVCGAWAWYAATQAGWDTLARTVGAEAAQRFEPHRGGRSYPWSESLTFPLHALAAHLPLTALALWTLRPGFAGRLTPGARFLLLASHCAVWPSVLFWSVLPEHAARFAFPIAPGLTGLAALAALDLAKRRRVALVVGLVVWLLVKLAFVDAVMPRRAERADAIRRAAVLTEHVPSGEILYLAACKDEGLMFYYGRPVRKAAVGAVPRGGYALLTEREWQPLRESSDWREVTPALDQQGDPVVLARRN